MDSTRLNLGLIVNHDTPLSKINIATVSQELKNFGITQRQSKSTSEINIGNHEAELINFGSFEEEENQNSNIKRAKNSFQKISNPFLNNNLEVIIKKRESLSEKLLLNLSKNFDKKKSKLMDFYEIRKRILTLTQQKREIETSSIFHFKNLSHLRLLPDYRINIPKLCLHQDRHQCKKRLYELSFETLLELLMRKENHTNYKPEKLFALYGVPDLEKRVKVFVYNEFTAIPYIIVNSNKKRKNEHMQSANRENNFKHNVRLQKNPICLVVHDFFHNFLEYIAFYQKLANNFFNKTFILFNFPGQAFTIYNEQEYFNNVSISNLIDSLLYHLNEKKYISLDYETFKMIGLGYGGLILSYFLGSFEDAISFNSGLFINSFAFLDEITFSTLKTVIETFESSPEELPELAFDYYWRLTCSRRASDLKSLKEKYNKNPLKRQAMDYILKGCFQCVNCSKKIQSCKMPLFIIHSLQNSLIRVSQADIFNKLREEQSGMSFGLKLRKCAYIDGGHDVIEVDFF